MFLACIHTRPLHKSWTRLRLSILNGYFRTDRYISRKWIYSTRQVIPFFCRSFEDGDCIRSHDQSYDMERSRVEFSSITFRRLFLAGVDIDRLRYLSAVWLFTFVLCMLLLKSIPLVHILRPTRKWILLYSYWLDSRNVLKVFNTLLKPID